MTDEFHIVIGSSGLVKTPCPTLSLRRANLGGWTTSIRWTTTSIGMKPGLLPVAGREIPGYAA
jgi:hypothetical protein